MDTPLTPQQKSLNTNAFKILATPISDSDFDDVDDSEITEDDFVKDSVIPPSFRNSITISVNESMDVTQVLTSMANLAGVNIFIADNVGGTVSFVAKDRPFLEILKDVCSTLNLKYTISGNSVKIENDIPILKVYNVQFLNLQRDTQSSVSISTDIFMNNSVSTDNQATTSLESTNNGSKCEVSGKVKNDFWQELENTLKAIISTEEGAYLSLHRQGGLVTVYATDSKQKEIQKYLKLLKETTESQVLIEAKILEVVLNNEYKNGINWDIFSNNNYVTLQNSTASLDGLISTGVNKTLNNKFSIMSGIIEKFGAVKTLSSPRITVLNNQSAILKVAQNEVIYLPELQKQYGTLANNTNIDYMSAKIHTIPIGLVMSVQPSIDRKTNSITLTLRPTISKIVGNKKIPMPFYYNNIATNPITTNNSNSAVVPTITMQEIPIVDIREMDSVLKLKSGQIVVMGGLMQEQSANRRDGLPRTRNTSLEFLTGTNEKSTKVTELIIFLRATILKKKKAHHNTDRKLYNTFANDPRPINFTTTK